MRRLYHQDKRTDRNHKEVHYTALEREQFKYAVRLCADRKGLIEVFDIDIPYHRHKDYFDNDGNVSQDKLSEILLCGFTRQTSKEYRRYALKHCKLKISDKQLDEHNQDKHNERNKHKQNACRQQQAVEEVDQPADDPSITVL